MIIVEVLITLKKDVVDIEGETIKKALNGVGYSSVKDVKVSKKVILYLDEKKSSIDETVTSICNDLLHNSVIEDYSYKVV